MSRVASLFLAELLAALRLLLLELAHPITSFQRTFPRVSWFETSARLSRMDPLVDSWGREIKSLRVSVTDKCNFRCRYCMPAEGLEWLQREQLLSFEEIARLVRVLAAMGVEEVRLTGGEPLVRRELPLLVHMLAEIPGVDDLS